MDTEITKSEVVERLEGDWSFASRALLFITDRQTDIELAAKATIYKNHRGLCVPLARIGTDLADAVRSGAALTWQDILHTIEVCSYHWRQAGMLMLMDQGFTIQEAAYMLYPIKTPRTAPRAARSAEVDRARWALQVEVELDQAYQAELHEERVRRQLAAVEALVPTNLPVPTLVSEETIATVQTLATARVCRMEELYVEGIGLELVAC
jgi:hypothetical protein